MYRIEFYEDARGHSELHDQLKDMEGKAHSNKNIRIQYRQMVLYIQLLQNNGTEMNENITKHLKDGIWELRPGKNRVLYFYYRDGAYVLLHMFRKPTQKTPRREIERAKAERADYLSRHEG